MAGNVHPKMYGIDITVTKARSHWTDWSRWLRLIFAEPPLVSGEKILCLTL
jgi:hypothetical protein